MPSQVESQAKSMYENGFIWLKSECVSMNAEEYSAYCNWLSMRNFSIKGMRFYEGKARYETVESYSMREGMSREFPNWFKLKCIARRIYELDREKGVSHRMEAVTWLETPSKGYHAVVTSTGRVFHVICNASRWGHPDGTKGREVVELKRDARDWTVRIGDCYKQAKPQKRVSMGKGGKVSTHYVWLHKVSVRKALGMCFDDEILKNSLSPRDYAFVKSYGKQTERQRAATCRSMHMRECESGRDLFFESIKGAAESFGMKPSTFKTRLKKDPGHIEIDGRGYDIVGMGEKAPAEKKAKKSKRKPRMRSVKAAVKATSSYKGFKYREGKRWHYGYLYEVYEKWLSISKTREMEPADRMLIYWELLDYHGVDATRWSDEIYKDVSHAGRVRRLRKYWGRRRWEDRKAEFKADRTRFRAWVLRKCNEALERRASRRN